MIRREGVSANGRYGADLVGASHAPRRCTELVQSVHFVQLSARPFAGSPIRRVAPAVRHDINSPPSTLIV
jgi:hypothetical protein